ncbi:MAG: hypothetical protein E6I48_07840 [Chloroflexi bacterium]|nr:MAG: hypothetical protein E6I48_07840 [Chloroflexota bacterium]
MPFILLTPGRDPRTTRCYLATNRRVGGKVRRAKQSLGEFHAPGVFYAEGIVLLERQIALVGSVVDANDTVGDALARVVWPDVKPDEIPRMPSEEGLAASASRYWRFRDQARAGRARVAKLERWLTVMREHPPRRRKGTKRVEQNMWRAPTAAAIRRATDFFISGLESGCPELQPRRKGEMIILDFNRVTRGPHDFLPLRPLPRRR